MIEDRLLSDEEIAVIVADAKDWTELPYMIKSAQRTLTATYYQQEMWELWELLGDLTDPNDCSLDHHGHCQEHGWTGNGLCPHFRAKFEKEKHESTKTKEG